MSSEYIFEMRDITKAFALNVVLDGVSIAIKPVRLGRLWEKTALVNRR